MGGWEDSDLGRGDGCVELFWVKGEIEVGEVEEVIGGGG